MYHVDNKEQTRMKVWPIRYVYVMVAQREGVHLYEFLKNVGVAHRVCLRMTNMSHDGTAL